MSRISTMFDRNIAFIVRATVDLQFNGKVIKKGSDLIISIPELFLIPECERKIKSCLERSDLTVNISDGAGTNTGLNTMKIEMAIADFCKQKQGIKATFMNPNSKRWEIFKIPADKIKDIQIIDIYNPKEENESR